MKIQLRRDAFTNWASNGTVLLDGEIAYSSTNNHIKIGNGFDTYADLPSFIKYPFSGNVVNTTATQTLTNKTFVGAAFNTNETVTSLETNLEATTLNLARANVITLNAGTVLANVGAGFQNMEVLTTVGTGTWTLPDALRKIGAKFKVTAVGGGAGGAAESNSGDRGPGGGSGAVVIGFYTVNNLANTSMSYGVGAGGLGGGQGAGNDGQAGSPSNTTYNGITFSAGGAAAVTKDTTPGGTGGTATGGTLNFNGFRGHQGTISKEATNSTIFGKGADTPLGFGQGGDIVLSTPTTSTGSTASGYGSGGSGGDGDSGAGDPNRDGTSGAQGIIIIEY